MKFLAKNRLIKLPVNNKLPNTAIFFFPNFSERIPEKIVATRIPKALSDNEEPTISRLTMKVSDNIGIKGPTVELPIPSKKNCVKNSIKNLLLIIIFLTSHW